MENNQNNLRQLEIIQKLRVLIVEDNPVDRELLKNQLEKIGFKHIQVAQHGSEGIFKIENSLNTKKQFHIIITDWKMPERDGLSLVKYLRSVKSLRSTRVVMLTSVSDQEKVKEALKEGIDDFVLKPVDYEILNKKIEKILFQMLL